jgi:twitching motility protein PilI
MAYPVSNTEAAARTGDVQTAQVAQQTQPVTKWLACISPQNRYLFPMDHTGEILRGATVTRVPFTQSWFCGLISLRGKLHGVIDLPEFLAISRGEVAEEFSGLRRQVDDQSGCILTLSALLGMKCGLVVGKLEGLRSSDDFQRVATSDADCGPLISGIYRDLSGSHWLEVNLIDLVASYKTRSISIAETSP